MNHIIPLLPESAEHSTSKLQRNTYIRAPKKITVVFQLKMLMMINLSSGIRYHTAKYAASVQHIQQHVEKWAKKTWSSVTIAKHGTIAPALV